MNYLKPDKYTDINNTLLNKTAFLIKILRQHDSLKLYDLYNLMKNNYSFISDKDFVYAIDILFIFDKILYDVENDMIGLKNEN